MNLASEHFRPIIQKMVIYAPVLTKVIIVLGVVFSTIQWLTFNDLLSSVVQKRRVLMASEVEKYEP